MSDVKYLRRCIQIRAEDSPNVRWAKLQQARGEDVTGERIVAGVLTWQEYCERRLTLPKSRQCVVLDAEWYEGSEEKLVPWEWMQHARAFADTIARAARTLPRYMGIDTAAGGDDSAWVIGDRWGVMHCENLKTPNTNDVYGKTMRLMRDWNVPPERVCFDLGGGGREHAHRLRANGMNVRAVGFGRPPALETKRPGLVVPFAEKRDVKEDADAFPDRRSEMAWDARLILERDAAGTYVARDWYGSGVPGFALPAGVTDVLCQQMKLPPIRWDGKGRFKLIPKENPNDLEDMDTFRRMLQGRSPDVFDAFCLMVFGMTHKPVRLHAGAG